MCVHELKLWTGEQFDDVAVGIANENLPRAIRTFLARLEIGIHSFQVRFPFVEIIHAECEMISAMMRLNRLRALTDQMQFLVAPQTKPCSGKSKGGARQRIEPQNVAVKSAGGWKVGDM